MSKESLELWDRYAQWWQDEFTDGVDAEYTEQILPLIVSRLAGFTSILDVGTGEGQVARALAGSVEHVVGIDPIPSQTALAAKRSGREISLVNAVAEGLPFIDNSFDAAVACLVVEHIDALDDAVSEIARVIVPRGRFLLLLNHPLLQTPNSGWIDDQVVDPPEQYWRIGAYLHETETVDEVTKGVFIRFVHRPLSRYINALADHGLLIEKMDEPAPPPGFIRQEPSFEAAAFVPRLLALTCYNAGQNLSE